MINLKNILKVLLIALFVCAWSGDVWALNDNETDQRNVENQLRTDPGNNKRCDPPCNTGEMCIDGKCRKDTNRAENSAKDVASTGGGGKNDASFCSGDLGIFKELVQTGQMIFNRLRDLIYVVAGFGIIAVAVGGFFGNLNWKWLGAIVISLVVIATAGELVALMTGCQSFNGSLITNTLTNPTPTMSTQEYAEAYTEEVQSSGKISWDDSLDKEDHYAGESSASISEDEQSQEETPGDNSTTETSNNEVPKGKKVNVYGDYSSVLKPKDNNTLMPENLDFLSKTRNEDKYY